VREFLTADPSAPISRRGQVTVIGRNLRKKRSQAQLLIIRTD